MLGGTALALWPGPLLTLRTFNVAQTLKECIWLNWVPVAKIPKIGTIISVGLQGNENKLTRMKSAQKISHAENNYPMFSETKGLCIITRNNLLDLAITMLYLLLHSAIKVTNQFYFENNLSNYPEWHKFMWIAPGLRAEKIQMSSHVPLFLETFQTASVLGCVEFVTKMGHKLIQVEKWTETQWMKMWPSMIQLWEFLITITP